MGKLTKKNKAFMLMILGIILLVGGIAVSISLGAKNIDINTILRSILSDGNDINSKIKEAYIYSDIYGSDHCPVGLEIEI